MTWTTDDDAFIAKLTAELDSFCQELAMTVKKLRELGGDQ